MEPNKDFLGLICEGAIVLPSKFLEDAFRDGYGRFTDHYSFFYLSSILCYHIFLQIMHTFELRISLASFPEVSFLSDHILLI